MSSIRIDVGVDTILEVDLSQINFDGIKEVIFTIKNEPSVRVEPVVERKFTQSKVHTIKITAEESLCIRDKASYDFQQVLADGTRTKMTENGTIELRYSVGDKLD